jgi:hypothetical protein
MLLPCSIEKKAKFHRKRVNEEEGDITYINEHNRVFNKKVSSTFIFAVTKSANDIDFLSDFTVLRQVHCGNSRELRAWNSSLIHFCIFRAFILVRVS